VEGVRYALTKLSKLKNVHNYVDAAHSGWLGWEDKFKSGSSFLAAVVSGSKYQKYVSNEASQWKPVTDGAATALTTPTAAPGWAAINGFISNTANYTPLKEKVDPTKELGGTKLISATFYDWNPIIDETAYGTEWIKAMKALGAPSTIGMLVDTGRNGWGKKLNNPNIAGTDIDKTVNDTRVDQRPHRGSWCNQAGGVGERPKAQTGTFHAYVWTKPQGESDGISYGETDPRWVVDPNDPNKRHDEMCDPEGENHYAEEATTTEGKGVKTGALPDAPHAGRWYSLGFKTLVENANPPL
jgi:cellulose 1,4-beta-cellobiosidase